MVTTIEQNTKHTYEHAEKCVWIWKREKVSRYLQSRIRRHVPRRPLHVTSLQDPFLSLFLLLCSPSNPKRHVLPNPCRIFSIFLTLSLWSCSLRHRVEVYVSLVMRHGKLVENFSQESDVMSLQDPWYCQSESMFDHCVWFGLLFTSDNDLGRTLPSWFYRDRTGHSLLQTLQTYWFLQTDFSTWTSSQSFMTAPVIAPHA